MKAVLISALLCLALTGYGQALPLDSLTHKVSYQAVTQVPGATAELIYGKAKAWAATAIGPRMEVALDDQAAHVFIARVGTIVKTRAAVGSFDQTLWQTLHIEARDGRYQYILTDFVLQPYVYSQANTTAPSKAQLRQVPIEEALQKKSATVYSRSIAEATAQVAASEIEGLRKAVTTGSGW